MKRSRATRLHPISWPMMASFPFLPLVLHAAELPAGPRVSAGVATVTTPAATSMLVTQASQRAIIKWKEFSIGAGNSVTFAQPNAAAATLNIVTGNTASVLAGRLNANGSVFLVNENGITVTAGGLVDTRSGFIASTLGMGEDEFMAGSYRFGGAGAAVVNRGTIRTGPGGAVVLLGGQVGNEGVIEAPLGKVALGSGQLATLDLQGDGFLQVTLPATTVLASGEPLVSNSGAILANGGSVMLKAATLRSALRNAVNMSGDIQAHAVSGHDGAVLLEGGAGGAVTVAGTITVSSQAAGVAGGAIAIGGDSVALTSARLDASAPDQAGLVRVGGAFQGGRVQAPGSTLAARFLTSGAAEVFTNARSTSIDGTSRIDVSASGAQGKGGTAVVWSDLATTMVGTIAAGGARSGGAVEISSAGHLNTPSLGGVSLGPGGVLLLDPKNITIDAVGGDPLADLAYGDNSGGDSRLRASELTALLSTGTTVNLQASQDINWLNNFSFVSRTANAPGGTLNLSAGRSITLTGIFNTGGGNWNLVANDSAAHGVVDADRGPGYASINLVDAKFINSNGALNLTLADGAGNTNRDFGGIGIGQFSGTSLTATTPLSGFVDLVGDITTSGDVTLTGDLEFGAETIAPVISGHRVSWIGENTGASITGYGLLKFVEDGIVTRLARFGMQNAAPRRFKLGDDLEVSALTRVYGDAEPAVAALGENWFNNFLAPGSLTISGPGAAAGVGQYTAMLGPTADVSLTVSSSTRKNYYFDLTPIAIPMTIEKRTLAVTARDGAYVYGAPTALVGLSNIANGDVLTPLASLNGAPAAAMLPIDSGYGYAATLGAGNARYLVSGLAGAAAGNYQFDPLANLAGSISIDQKALHYQVGGGGHTYGLLNMAPAVTLDGIVGTDDVNGVASLSGGAGNVALTSRTDAGAYQTVVTALAGQAAGNYRLAPSGNLGAEYIVSRLGLSYNAGLLYSQYGTMAEIEGFFPEALPGDHVTMNNTLRMPNGQPVALSSSLPVGSYGIEEHGLTGASAANYQLIASGIPGSLTVRPKPLSYVGGVSSQIYGADGALQRPLLDGVLAGDEVYASSRLTALDSYRVGESGKPAAGMYRLVVDGLTGAASANYVLGQGLEGQLTITPKVLTYQLGAASSVYGSAPAPGTGLIGIVPYDVIGGTVFVSDDGNPKRALRANTRVGSYAYGIGELTGYGAGNYVLSATGNTDGILSITPKLLNWNLTDASSVYGSALSNQPQLDVLAGDDVRATLAAVDVGGAMVARPVVGPAYSAVVTGLAGSAAGNYQLAREGNHSGAVTITPMALTPLSMTSTTTEYGSAFNPYISAAGILPGDAVRANILIGSSDNFIAQPLRERSPVGAYVAYVDSLTGNPNYTLSPTYDFRTVTAPYKIVQRQLSYSIPDSTAVYGSLLGLNPAVTLIGVLPGDAVNGGSFGISDAASYPVRPSVGVYPYEVPLLGGADSMNYVIPFRMQGSLTITPRPVTTAITYKLENGSTGDNLLVRDYGELAPSLMVNTSVRDLLPGDAATVQLNAPLLPASGAGKLPVGNYQWTTGSISNPNYTASKGATLMVAINPIVATYEPATFFSNSNNPRETSVYGNSANTEVHNKLNGVLTGDRMNPGQGYFVFDGFPEHLPSRAPVGGYGFDSSAPSGLDSGNYVFNRVLPTSGFEVTPRPAQVRLQPSESVFGDQGKYGAVVFDSILPGDEISAVLTGAVDHLQDVGAYKVSIKEFVGSSAGNYSFDPKSPNVALSATWKVLPRPLTLIGDTGNISLTYGDADFLNRSYSMVNLAQFRDVTVVVNAEKDHQLYAMNHNRLDAGLYNIVVALTGTDAHNYVLAEIDRKPPTFGQLNISKRLLSITIAPELEYGGTPAPTLSNLAAGDEGKLNVSYAYLEPLRYGFLDLGHAFARPTPDASSLWRNYVAPTEAHFVVVPRTLKFDDTSIEYGTIYEDRFGNLTDKINLFGINLGMPTNLIGGDNKPGVVTANLGDFIKYKAALTENDYSGYKLSASLPVGSYTVAGSVQEKPVANPYPFQPDGPHYRIGPTSLKLTVTPRTLWAYGVQQRQYGNFALACPDGCDPYTSGELRFSNVLKNEDVYAGFLLPGNGSNGTVAFDSKTPVGLYQNVGVSALAGKDAGNYKLDPQLTGKNAMTLEVVPLYLDYKTSSALIIGKSLFGELGKATLLGPYGTGAINGDEVRPVVVMQVGGVTQPGFLPLADLIGVRHEYVVSELTGKDAANYRLYPTNTSPGIAGRSHANLVGSVTQVEDFTFGFAASSPISLVNSMPTVLAAPLANPPVLYMPANQAQLTTIVAADGSSTSIVTGGTSVNGQASSATAASGSMALGGAESGGGTRVAATAGVHAGPGGASIEAKAGVGGDVEVSTGPVTVTVAANGIVTVVGAVGPTSVSGTAEAALQVNATATAQGEIGPGIDGNATIHVGASAGAKATAKAGLDDWSLTVKSETLIGSGTTAGGQVGFATSAGSVNTGASVYSPGLVGGNASVTGGYADGDITVGLNLGAAIGIGGVSVKLEFSIDVANMIDTLSDANQAFSNMLMMRAPTPQDRATAALKTAGSFGNNKMARLAFLESNEDWHSGGNVDGFGAAQADLRAFTLLKAQMNALAKDKADAQKLLLTMFSTSPAAAASWFSHENYIERFQARDFALQDSAKALGIKFTNTGGVVSFSNL